MQLSKEQAEEFYSICKNLLNMQQKAGDMFGRMQRSEQPYAAEAYRVIADSFDPLTKFIYEKLDFQKGIDDSQLKEFNKLYSNTKNDLDQIKNSQLGEYTHDDYIWEPMHRLDVGTTDFLKKTQEIQENSIEQVAEQQTPAPNIEQTVTKEPQKAETKEQPKILNEQPQTKQEQVAEQQTPAPNIEQTIIKEPQKAETKEQPKKNDKQPQVKQDKQLGVGTVYALLDVLGKQKDSDPNSFDNMWAALKQANDKGLLSEQMKQEYRDIISWAKDAHVPKSDATQRLTKTLFDQLDALDKTSLVQSQHKSIDAINKVKDFVSAYNEFNANGDFGQAQYEIDKMAKYIGAAARQGLISNGVANDYRRIIKQIYGQNNEKMQKYAADELIRISDMHKNRIISGQQSAIKEPEKTKADQARKIAAFKRGQENAQNLINEQNKNKQNQSNNLYYMMMQQRMQSGGQ